MIMMKKILKARILFPLVLVGDMMYGEKLSNGFSTTYVKDVLKAVKKTGTLGDPIESTRSGVN